MRRLSYHARVQQEVNEAVRWYDEQRETLGDDFFAKLSETLRQIAAHPERFSFWMDSRKVRRVKLKRFPYHVLFEIRTDGVRVLCVRHEKRHPGFGLGRR